MRLAQQNLKALQTPENNSILGRWIKDEIGVQRKQFVEKSMLERYGTTRVLFRKYDDGAYLLDIDPKVINRYKKDVIKPDVKNTSE